jgi:hypothetical protein
MWRPALLEGDLSGGRRRLASQSRPHTTLEKDRLVQIFRSGTGPSMASSQRGSSRSGAVASDEGYSFAPPTWRANVDGVTSAMG